MKIKNFNLGLGGFLGNNPKLSNFLPQAVTLFGIIFVIGFFTFNAQTNMDTRCIDFGFGFGMLSARIRVWAAVRWRDFLRSGAEEPLWRLRGFKTEKNNADLFEAALGFQNDFFCMEFAQILFSATVAKSDHSTESLNSPRK